MSNKSSSDIPAKRARGTSILPYDFNSIMKSLLSPIQCCTDAKVIFCGAKLTTVVGGWGILACRWEINGIRCGKMLLLLKMSLSTLLSLIVSLYPSIRFNSLDLVYKS